MSIFKTQAEMPAAERPFAKPVERDAGAFVMMEMPKAETVRSMMTPADRRIAREPALMPMSGISVQNITPAKRGRHY